MIAVLEPRDRDAYRLTADSISEMTRPVVKVAEGVSWALGWAVQHTPMGDYIFHSGGIDGTHCMSVASVPNKTGFVVMTNGQNGYKLIETLMRSESIAKLL